MDILITMENVFVPGGQSAGTKCVLIAVHFVDSTVRLTGIKIKDIPVTGTDQAGSCVIGGGIIVTDGTVNAGGIQKAIDQHHRKVFRCFYNIGIILCFHLDKF